MLIAQKQLLEKDSQFKRGQEQSAQLYEQARVELDSAKGQHVSDIAKLRDCERHLSSAKAEIDACGSRAQLTQDEALDVVTRERRALLAHTQALTDQGERGKSQYEQAILAVRSELQVAHNLGNTLRTQCHESGRES